MFVYPKFERYLKKVYAELFNFPRIASLWEYRMPPALGIQILIALTPPDIEWKIIDENLEEIDYNEDVDLVAISFFTPQAESAYRIGDKFKERKVKVIMGGMHPSMIPEDAALHCDSICIGEAEIVWKDILDDARNNSLKKIYGPVLAPPSNWVKPARNVYKIKENYDWHASLVQVARGCPRDCPYCNIPGIYGRNIRLKNMDSLVEEISELSGEEFYIIEDIIMFNSKSIAEYTKELFTKILPYKNKIFLTSSLIFNAKPDFLQLLAGAGTKSIYVTFGFDPISRGIYKNDRKVIEYGKNIIDRIQNEGIRLYAAFGIGFDEDDESVFDAILDFCKKAHIVTSEFFIVTPFPNTPLWYTLKNENRIIHTRWNEYNCSNVVFKPRRITEDKLQSGFLYLWKEFYTEIDHVESLSCFAQKQDNIEKTIEYMQKTKKEKTK
ncbi:MAG: cobalamin-dependent protein [Spirochaetales bacterium]|nr:cobalamin-dependent protein [Spirochaetales bacterium]